MLSNYVKQLILGAAATAIVMASAFAAHAEDSKFPHHEKTNINLAVASNFYGVPPNNSAITDLINSTVVFCHCWRPCDTLRPSPTPCVKGQMSHAASHRGSCSHRDRPCGHLS
jgi:hypothetical protein